MCPDKYTLQNTKKTKGRDSLLAHYALKTVKLFCLLRSQLKRHLSFYPCNTLFAKLTADEAGSRKFAAIIDLGKVTTLEIDNKLRSSWSTFPQTTRPPEHVG